MEDIGDVLTESEFFGLFESVTVVNKKAAYKIDVHFSRRFRIWRDQILPGRMNEIKTENTVEFVHRMMRLLFADGDRLTNRAIKEGHSNNEEMMVRIGAIDKILEEQMMYYLSEIDRIKLMLLDKKGDINADNKN